MLLYSPLSMVYDYAGGTPTAFQIENPVHQCRGWLSSSHQEVRAVWLLNMLTDVCKPRPEGFHGRVVRSQRSDPVEYRYQSRMVNTYNEEFSWPVVEVQRRLRVGYGGDLRRSGDRP